MSKYRKEHFYRYLPNGYKQQGVKIIAKNGVEIAECSTEKMADKIIKGLDLYDLDVKKKESFRL